MEHWTIPFDGTNYLVYKVAGEQKYKKLSPDEEREYFLSPTKEEFVNDLLNRG